MPEAPDPLPTRPAADGLVPRPIIAYSLASALLSVVAFIVLLKLLPHAATSEASDPAAIVDTLVFTSVLMLAAGTLGGCLYNFRGLVKHSQECDFDPNYNLSYVLRPIQGALSGLMVFFLLLGGALTLNIGGAAQGTAWATLPGVLPYVAFGVMAGYASHEFMQKLKDLAESLFALRRDSGGRG